MTSKKVIITQGEQAIDGDRTTTISTLLGSCVACCIWDPVAAVGGMNHMLLANRSMTEGTVELRGINEMELLINALLKSGANRERLLAKAFGGASMVTGLSDIGAMNGKFTLDYLAREGVECVSHSLGGTSARQLVFWPATGAVRQKLLSAGPLPSVMPINMADEGNGIEFL